MLRTMSCGERYVAAGNAAVRRCDWSVVASQDHAEYEAVAGSGTSSGGQLMTWRPGRACFVALAAFGAWGYQTANRLNRLNVRYDLSAR